MTSERGGMAVGGPRATAAWRDAMEAMIDGYGAPWRQMTEWLGGLWGMPPLDGDQARESMTRIAEAFGRVVEAQTAVASESLRMPFWWTGGASPGELQAAYARLFDAQGELFRVYLDVTLGWQRAQAGATQRAGESAQRVVDSQVQTARRVADDAREVQKATVDAVRATTEAAGETATRAVEEARQIAEDGAAQAERERRRAERERERERAEAAEQAERERQREARARAREERGRFERAAREIKGNVNREGERIYHLPGQAGYERVQAEELFATEEEAQASGYRRSGAPGGGAIKGVVRGGERVYHLPGQASYDRIEEADMRFETEEQAQANGFRPAQR